MNQRDTRPERESPAARTGLRAHAQDTTEENTGHAGKQSRWPIATAVLAPIASAAVFVIWVLATSRYEQCTSATQITKADAWLFALLPTAVTAAVELGILGPKRTLGPVVACVFISAALGAACMMFALAYCNSGGG